MAKFHVFCLLLCGALASVQSASVGTNKLPAKLEREPETEAPLAVITEEIPANDVEEDVLATEDTLEGSSDTSDESEEDLEAVEKKSDADEATPSLFGINFGRSSGGTISISNSYNTGKHGSALSESKAFFSPQAEIDDE
jgi:hypothetical protein